ncbi:MAG: MFS transporter [Candidatus Bipolaricaulaceae bacterium]
MGRVSQYASVHFYRFLQTAGLGAFSIFLPVLLRERGLSFSQIGLLNAALTLVTLGVAPLWAAVADTLGRTKPFLVQATGVCFVSALVLPQLFGFTQFLSVQTILALLTPPAEGLLVTAVFRAGGGQDHGAIYSGFALWGSLGWALGVASAGWIVNQVGTSGAFYYGGAWLALATLWALRFEEPRGERASPQELGFRGAAALLRARNLRLFLFSLLPLALALNAAARFFPLRLTQAGGSPFLLGLVYAVPALLEVPVFLGLRRISPRLPGRRPLLLWSATVYAFLALLLAGLSQPFALFWGYVLLAPLGWAPFITGCTALMAEMTPPTHWVTGQTLLTLWLWSVGGSLGPLAAGFLAEALGLAPLFGVLGAWYASSALLLLVWVKETPVSPG